MLDLLLKKKKSLKGRTTAAAHLSPPSSPHVHTGVLLHYNIHIHHKSWQGNERCVSEGYGTMPISSPLLLEKHFKQHLGRYKGKNKEEIGKREEDVCSQLFVLLTGFCASKESRNHAVRWTGITGDGAGVSDPVP